MKINKLNSKRLVQLSLYKAGLKFGLNKDFVTSLCYHSISNTSDKYAVKLSNFKKQIEAINKKAKFISGNEMENIINGKKINNWNVCLTIDDGYKDVKSIIPLVQQLNITVILFVMSGGLNVNRAELNNNHKLLSFNEIKKLKKLGWTIGCHSATHADLSSLTNKELKAEIVQSKEELEKNLGFKINYFAYPKGIVNLKILKVVKKAGYKLAFTTNPGVINSKTNSLLVPRTVIEKSRRVEDFPYFISETGIYLRGVIENLGIWKMIGKFN